MQSTRGKGYKRRWSSWYDPGLVTGDGEALLSEIDDRAIILLRKFQLLWSSWTFVRPHFEVMGPSIPTHSFRQVPITPSDAKAIHRFFASIAWRASASNLADLDDVKLTSEVEESLRQMIISPSEDDWLCCPVSLTQLTTKGEQHNQSPYLTSKVNPAVGDEKAVEIPFMRIYLDGLIAHVHCEGLIDRTVVGNGLFLGAEERLALIGIEYEASFQYTNMLLVAMEAYAPCGSLSKS